MLFILIGLGLLLIMAILITLFSMNIPLGLLGILALLVVLIFMGRKIMRVQNLSQQKEEEDFRLNLKKSFGEDEGKRIEEVLQVRSANKSHCAQNILYINDRYRISEQSGKEAVLDLLQKLS